MSQSVLVSGVSVVAIAGRGVMICGESGSGKSSLALALIDRGGVLVGDDAVTLQRSDETLIAAPPPNIAGKIELRGVGIAEMPTTGAPLALILDLDREEARYPLEIASRSLLGISLPLLGFRGGDAIAALRAERALAIHGLKTDS